MVRASARMGQVGRVSIMVCLLLVFSNFLIAVPQQSNNSRPRIVSPSTSPVNQPGKGVPQQDEQEKDSLQLGVTNIVLPVTVIDQKDRFVPNLARTDFMVLEDNRPQKILEFRPSFNVSTDTVIMVDASSSVKEKFAFEQAAAINFIQGLLAQSDDRVAVGSFNDDIKLLQDYSREPLQLTKAINSLRAGGRTRLYDAVYQTVQEKAGTDPGRRTAIVLLTDGADTASSHSFQQTLALAQQKQVMIYGLTTEFLNLDVNMNKRENEGYLNRGERELRDLCLQTGGRLFFPKDEADVARLFTQIREELRNQYIIVYEPSNSNSDGRFRAIEVRLMGKLTDRPWQVRTRRGYFAGRGTNG